MYSNVVLIFVSDINGVVAVKNNIEWDTLKAIIINGGNNQTYAISVNGDIGLAGSTANTFGSLSGLSVTLKGSGSLYLTGQGSLFRVGANQTLIIDGLTLQGLANNNTSAVYVDGSTAQLELRDGTISGNTAASSSTASGGGVYVASGAFTMSGGKISGNTASASSYADGGGVYVANGAFTMNGGEISGNTSSASSTSSSNNGGGGGVYVASGAFTMSDGKISGNTVTASSNNRGGGVYVNSNATFTMSGGVISGNTAANNCLGGGVSVNSNGTFTMSGGVISGNTAYYGGGVFIDSSGGSSGIFRIVTGIIYGSNEGEDLRNYAYLSGSSLHCYDNSIAQRGTFSGQTWNSLGSLSATHDTITVENGMLFSISDIVASIWREGSAITLTAPTVNGFTPASRGWQTSDTGSGGWTNFTPPATANMSLNGKYLRYYATSSSGTTVYSKVVPIFISDSNNVVTITNSSEWNAFRTIILNGGDNKTYTISIDGDIGLAGSTTNTFGDVTGLSVTLKGTGRLYLTSQGNLLRVGAYQTSQTLIIDGAGLTLQGLRNGQNGSTQDNNNSVVYLYGGAMELRNGTVSGNTTSSSGGGVYVNSNATFTMSGGEISGNTANNGGGVYVSGTFTMSGGEISGNTANNGGGVYVYNDRNTIFRVVNGMVYGSEEIDTGLRNTASSSGAALYRGSNGSASYGTFSGSNWNINGYLSTTNDTIRVVNGALQ